MPNTQMRLEAYPTLHASQSHCQKTLQKLSHELQNKLSGPLDHICVFAVGSYGRGEACPEVSDFEWTTVYDETLVGIEEARRFQADLTSYFASVFGRGSLSINKTFGDICSIANISTNVGGEADTSRTLTYRMLVLVEGSPLTKNDAYFKIIERLANTYGGSFTAGHRLLSLATDIARYYRTMRIDYKFKVDEGKKPWAVRSMKLRSARRIWYLASALHFVAFGARIDYEIVRHFDIEDVKRFMLAMGGNPVDRLLRASEKLEAGAPETHALISLYDAIQEELNDPDLRRYLETLDGKYKFDDARYESIHSKCRQLHTAAADLVISLREDHRRELIEMFLL